MASQMYLKPTWTMELDTDDLRLVLKALGGRLNSVEAKEAVALGDRLSRLRANATKDMANAADKLLNNIAEKEPEHRSVNEVEGRD